MLEELANPFGDVVAQHHRHFQIRRQAPDLPRASQRIQAARIGQHLDPAFPQLRGDAGHQWGKVTRIAEGLIPAPLFLKNGHGDFGQVVESQEVNRPLLHQPDRRFQPIPPKALAVGDSNHGMRSSARCPRFGLVVTTSSRKDRIGRVSTGSMMASTCPRAAA